MRIRLIVAAIAASALMMACGGGGKKDDTMGGGGGGGGADMAKKPLFDRLGGKEGITKVVDMFVANVAADARINSFFANTDIAHLKQMLVDQICDASSGGTQCKYTGKDMKTAHAGMGVKEEHFNALVEDLQKALNDAGVGAPEQKELLDVLGPMKGDIVQM